MNETQTIEVELIKESDDKLVKFANETGLEKATTSTLVEAFRPIFDKAKKALSEAQGVAESVKDATCVKEIRKSRACRLAIRAVRLESDETRKKQKQHALLYGRAVDGFHNILMADLSPMETALQEAEDIAERAEAARLAALKLARESALQPFLETPILGDLSQISETNYAKMLSDAKLLRQAKLDAIAKAEAEAKAKAEADRIERERIAAENAKLKAEAIAREAAAKAERDAAEKKLAAERDAAAKAAKEAADKARKEREAVEAKAKAERDAAEEVARKERLRLQAIAEVERQKLAAVEAESKALRDAEAKWKYATLSDASKEFYKLGHTCFYCEKCMPSPTWPHVLKFAARMEAKLEKNRHKGDRDGWLKDHPWNLVERILDETVEVQECFRQIGGKGSFFPVPMVELVKTPEETADECADVANFCMMVADCVTVQNSKAATTEASNEPANEKS